MIATENIEEGEQIAFIPRSMMINYIDTEKQGFCKMCPDLDQIGWFTRSDYRKLTLAVLENRDNPFSPLYHWIKTLQTDFSDHMMNMKNAETKWFKGSAFYGKL